MRKIFSFTGRYIRYILMVCMVITAVLTGYGQSITVISPNGGETWAGASIQTIAWGYTNVDNIKIEFTSDNGATWSTVCGSMPASAMSYSWLVPGAGSTQCKIKLTDLVTGIYDESDNVFTIPPSYIAVTYPNGGQMFTAGAAQYITWDCSGISNVKIEYSTDNGTNWTALTDSSGISANYKFYNWSVPENISGQYLIRVSDMDNPLLNDVSDAAFGVTDAPVPTAGKYKGGSYDGYSMKSYTVPAAITKTFTLNTGYQFISSYVTPPNTDMTVVLADLLNSNLSFVRSSTGNMLRKLGPSWVNNIGNWIITEGYLVKMNAPDDFSITGTPVDPLTPINLNTGYQFISYFHDYPMDASTAFTGIMNDNLSFIRNSGGDMLRKLGPNWVNNIGNVVPGEGYLAKMNAPATLIYPAGTKSESIKNNMAIQHFNFEGGNAADPVYTVYISDATINGYSLQSGDEIGVFDGQTLVGTLALTQTPTPENQTENAIPVFATLNSGEGFTANHPVTFKLWSQGQEYDGVNVTLSNPYGDAYTGKVYPNSDGVYSIASLTATLTGINSLDRTEVAVYPNPSNGTFTLELNSVKSQNFDVKIFNSLGMAVYQQLNVAANGKYSTEIGSIDLPEGIYTLTVTGKDANYIKKIVIRK